MVLKNLMSSYFSGSNQSLFQLILFIILFFLGWIFEIRAQNITRKDKWYHAIFNFKFVLVDIIPQILLGVFFISIMTFTEKDKSGLVYVLDLNHHYLLKGFCAFIFLDLGEYLYHILMHKIKRLWMMHIIHHSDTQVDVSTVFREHPLETIIVVP